MIIGDTFLWLHLPKTGGTSMNLLFRRKKLAGVVVDADSTAQKHDSVHCANAAAAGEPTIANASSPAGGWTIG